MNPNHRATFLLLTLPALALIGGCAGLGPPADHASRRAQILGDVYVCRRADPPPAVDGQLDEAAWAQAAPVVFMMPVTFDRPLSLTEARMVCDDRCLYISFRAADQDLFALSTSRDSAVYLEDAVEVFLKTDPRRDPYYEFEFSPIGTIFDAFFGKRGASGNGQRWTAWNCAGLKAVVRVDGTLNDWGDRDTGWTIEIAIPFAGLPTCAERAPRPGDTWLFNLARYDYSVHLPEGVQFFSSSPLTKPSFHAYADWRTLRFE
jgi:hypothetical protein